MGGYFPLGLSMAEKEGLESNIGHYFAFNSIAGTFAVPFSLYLSIRFGFNSVMLVGAIFYLSAVVIIRRY
jgi:hypothetical protein